MDSMTFLVKVFKVQMGWFLNDVFIVMEPTCLVHRISKGCPWELPR